MAIQKKSWERIDATVHKVEAQAQSFGDVGQPTHSDNAQFLAIITDFKTKNGVDRYGYREQRVTDAGGPDDAQWIALGAGRVGTTEDNGNFATAIDGQLYRVGQRVRIQSHQSATGRGYWRILPLSAACLGVVVCRGPNGEADFKDNRYWCQLLNVTNVKTADPLATEDVPADVATSKPRIVCVTNLGENNQKTHHAFPKSVCAITLHYGTDATLTYTTEYIDPEVTGEYCHKYCWYLYQITWTCPTGEETTGSFGAITCVDTQCQIINPWAFDPDKWVQVSARSDGCDYQYIVGTEEACDASPSECTNQSAHTPAAPDNGDDCPCSSTEASTCWYHYAVYYTCDPEGGEGTVGDVSLEESVCSPVNPWPLLTVDGWKKTFESDASCKYEYVVHEDVSCGACENGLTLMPPKPVYGDLPQCPCANNPCDWHEIRWNDESKCIEQYNCRTKTWHCKVSFEACVGGS